MPSWQEGRPAGRQEGGGQEGRRGGQGRRGSKAGGGGGPIAAASAGRDRAWLVGSGSGAALALGAHARPCPPMRTPCAHSPPFPTFPSHIDQSPPRTTRRGAVPTRAFLPFTLFFPTLLLRRRTMYTVPAHVPPRPRPRLASAAALPLFCSSFPLPSPFLPPSCPPRSFTVNPQQCRRLNRHFFSSTLLSFSSPSPLLLCSNQSHSLKPPPPILSFSDHPVQSFRAYPFTFFRLSRRSHLA